MKLLSFLMVFVFGCTIQDVVTRYAKAKADPLQVVGSLAAIWEVMTNFYKKEYPETLPPAKFYRSVFDIQKAVAREVSPGDLTAKNKPLFQREKEVKKFINMAVNGGSMDFARSLLGKGLYLYIKEKVDEGIPVRNIYEDSAIGYLEYLKETVGDVKFDAIIARKGAVTLMFVVDTTGSMADEITSARAIATRIIKEVRDYEVDFILSQFNDPSVGPITYMPQDRFRGDFLQAVVNLTAFGGGDCPELTYTGMLDALNAGPRYGSPMFVFTDATAKDNTPDNIIALKVVAQATGTSINFFTHPFACGKGIGAFREISTFTSGQVFPLTRSNEIKKFSSFVSNSLSDYTLVGYASPSVVSVSGVTGRIGLGGSRAGKSKTGRANRTRAGRPGARRSILNLRRIRRGVPEALYSVIIDDTLHKVIFTIVVERANTAYRVTLSNPRGELVDPVTVLSQTKIYEISDPLPGVWTIFKPKTVGKLNYKVRGLPKIVLEFGYIFFFKPHAARADWVHISYPIIGTDVKIILTIAGLESVDPHSLSLDIVDIGDDVIFSNLPLDRNPARSPLFNTTVVSNATPFKLKLKGKTRGGFSFQRLSSTLITPHKMHIRILYAGNEFTVKRGEKATIMVEVLNKGGRNSFTFSIHTRLGEANFTTTSSSKSKDLTRYVGRSSYILVTYLAPMGEKVLGKTDTLFIKAVDKQHREEAYKSVNLLIV